MVKAPWPSWAAREAQNGQLLAPDPLPPETQPRGDNPMTIQFRGETLRVTPPRTARFLRRTIPTARTTWVPRDAGLRAQQHRPGTIAPHTWPVRLTRCGEHPGTYGDNKPTRLQAAPYSP